MQPMIAIRAIAISMSVLAGSVFAQDAVKTTENVADQVVQIQQIRNATAKITYAGKIFLLDPFLAKKGAYPGFAGTFHSELRNPLVELPMPVNDIMKSVDAVIVTHTHLDHWDGGDNNAIPKDLPVFVQHEGDAKIIRDQGYRNVRILNEDTLFEGVHLTKIGGQHGTDEMYANPQAAALLGEAMGVVFHARGAKTIYFVGDTIWQKDVDHTLAQFNPDVIVINAGDARMAGYTGSIIMGKDDIIHAAQVAPQAVIVATHMEAINHMTLSRKALRDHVQQHGMQERVRIPADGETMHF